MTELLTILAIAGTSILGAHLWVWADEWLAAREDRKRIAREQHEATLEWLAVLAATDTPIYAEVWAESLHRDLEEC